MVIAIIVIMVFGLGFGVVAFLLYRKTLRRAKNIERGLKMVPLLIHLPPRSADTEAGARDVREVMREKVAQAEVLYNLIAGTATEGFKSKFYGQRHIALEMIATKGLIHFYAAVPVALVPVVENAIQTAYPGARIEEAEDHNIFNPQGKLSGTLGGELVLKNVSAYPIATIDKLERDPLEALINSLSDLQPEEGAGIQIMLRPAGKNWAAKSKALVKKMRHHAGAKAQSTYSSRDILMAAVKAPEERRQEIATNSPQAVYMTDLEQAVVKAIEDKTTLAGYETLIRVLVSSNTTQGAQNLLNKITASFSLYDSPGLNGFKFLPATDMAGLVTAFILRFFPPELSHTILNSQELASLFHLPDAQFTPNSEVERLSSKQVDGPVNVSSTGLLLGYNFFRGTKKEIHLSSEDRRRHTYIVGQTGTGKSTLLQNLAVQDMLAGNGFAFIDPHGDEAEKMLSMVPKNRAEDVIYFNPGDTEYPLGLNIFEFNTPDQKDFLVQEAINMLYKLYDPGHTGIIGPRYEHWFRNAALTLMSDPAGATFIEIPKVFTDTEFLKSKFKYLKDPTVVDFWTKEMAQTSDYHKSEMLGWFVSKFGAFQSNEIMRNIIGQPKSAFNLRDIMDNKKILIVNLSKGKIGELNSQLLGMIFVIKFQAAAMSRANVEEAARPDFCLYVDEFQNFSTDSFASILSEARKYHLNLIVANQFIGQLSDEIRDAVFGNVGTVVSYRTGPEDAEFLVKQFAPVFDAHDLVNVPNHNAVIRLMVSGLPSQPFSITALPPLGVENPQLGEAMKQLSAAKFGVNKAQVEQEIFARLNGKPTAPPLAPEAIVAGSPNTAPATPPTGGADQAPSVPTASTVPAPVVQPVPVPIPSPPQPASVVVASAPVPTPAPVATAPASEAPPSSVPLAAPAPQTAGSAVLDIKPVVPASTAPQDASVAPVVPVISPAAVSLQAVKPVPAVLTQAVPAMPSASASATVSSSNIPSQVQVSPIPPTSLAPAAATGVSSPAPAAAVRPNPDQPLFHIPVDPSEELAEYAAKVYPKLELPQFENDPAVPKVEPAGPVIVNHSASPVAKPATAPVVVSPTDRFAKMVIDLPDRSQFVPPKDLEPAPPTVKPDTVVMPQAPKLTQSQPVPSQPSVAPMAAVPSASPSQVAPPANQLPVQAPAKEQVAPRPISPSLAVPAPSVVKPPVVPTPTPQPPMVQPAAPKPAPALVPAPAPVQPATKTSESAVKPATSSETGLANQQSQPPKEPVKSIVQPNPGTKVSAPVNDKPKPPALQPITNIGVLNQGQAAEAVKPAAKPVQSQAVGKPKAENIVLPETKPDAKLFVPDPKAAPKPENESVKVVRSAKPMVAAGEIFVDEDGNVVQG